jgi:hypothetical protein
MHIFLLTKYFPETSEGEELIFHYWLKKQTLNHWQGSGPIESRGGIHLASLCKFILETS